MTLASGARLAQYEILGPLGAGGMGEVYRARDTRLQRTVAIKVLPDSLAGNEQALARFAREARAVAALSHPHIVALHDLDTDSATPFAVMELLEGETLRARLAGGALPVRRSVEWASQIARGLAAAHDKGIVHRDLKPENVFVTREGQVKILDFGLARLVAPPLAEGATASLSASPDSPATDAGTVLGTVGYMSPEQVRGEAADARSDIFALGTVLYEMLCGRRAFRGDTAVETLHAILKAEPTDIAPTVGALPPGLEPIVRRCMEKRPPERFQSARDLAFALDALSSSSTPTSGVGATRPATAARHPVRVVAAAAVFALMAGVTGWFARGPGAGLPTFQRLTFRRGAVLRARFSPDGQSIVYAAAWEGRPRDVYSSRVGSVEARSLALTGQDVQAVSRTGEIALRRGKTSNFGTFLLSRVPGEGGVVRDVLDDVLDADWTPAGELVVSRRTGGRQRLEWPLGHVVMEGPDTLPLNVRVSPHGDRLACVEVGLYTSRGRVVVIDSAGRRATWGEPFQDVTGLAWSPDGSEVWLTGTHGGSPGSTLLAVSERGERALVRSASPIVLDDVAADGRALLSQRDARSVLMASAGDGPERDLSWLDGSSLTAVAPDGSRVLFADAGTSGHVGAYLRALDGSPAVRLADGLPQAFSPDGTHVLVRTATDPSSLLVVPVGAGETRPLPTHGLTVGDGMIWLPDGRSIGLSLPAPGGRTRAHVLDLGSGALRPATPEGIDFSAVTADGRAFVESRPVPGGRRHLYPLDGGPARELSDVLSRLEVLNAAADGRRLYVRVPGSVPAHVDLVDMFTGETTAWRELIPADATGVTDIGKVWVSPDGRRYAYDATRVQADLYLVSGLR